MASSSLRSEPGTHPLPLSSHDRLLRAAKRLFAIQGYEATSTAAIARAAGTSESQLVKHFTSKEGLLAAVFDRGWQEINRGIAAVSHLRSGRDHLSGLLHVMLSALERDPELKELMMLESRRVRKDSGKSHLISMTEHYLHLVTLVDGLITDLQQRGEIRADLHPQAIRSGMIGMLEGLLRDRVLAQRSAFDAHYSEEDVRAMFGMFLKFLTSGK